MAKPVLSERQQRIGGMVAAGCTNAEIAAQLGLTEQIVKNVLHSLFDKLGVWNRVELVNYLGSSSRENAAHARQAIDAERVRALSELEILDTCVERVFDELASLACAICEAPIGVVSLADSRRHWFKARIGLPFAEAQRNISFCEHTIQQSGVFVVPDAVKDPRFRRNPLVTRVPNIRFYAGAPLLTPDGYALGSLCVIDRVPRRLRPQQLASLQSLAQLTLEQMQVRRRLARLKNERTVTATPMNAMAAPRRAA